MDDLCPFFRQSSSIKSHLSSKVYFPFDYSGQFLTLSASIGHVEFVNQIREGSNTLEIKEKLWLVPSVSAAMRLLGLLAEQWLLKGCSQNVTTEQFLSTVFNPATLPVAFQTFSCHFQIASHQRKQTRHLTSRLFQSLGLNNSGPSWGESCCLEVDGSQTYTTLQKDTT